MKTRTRKKTPLLDEGLGERLSMTEWRKHYVSSVTAEEEAWPQREPGSNLGRIFVLLLLLHVFIIGAVVLYNIISPKAPLSVRTDSKPALTGTMSAASLVSTGTGSAPAPATTTTPAPVKTVSSNTVTKPAATTPTPEPVKTKPAPAAAPKPADDGVLTYEVKSGDNVPGIASALGISAEDLVKMNNLANTDLYPGRKLEYRKPSSGSSTTPTPPALRSPTPALASNRNILINPAPVTPSPSNSKPKPDTLKADRPNPDAIPTAAKIEVSGSDADSVPHAVPIKSMSHVEDQLPAAKPKVKNKSNDIEDSPPAARSKSDSKSKSETKHKGDDAKPKKSSKTDKDKDDSPKTKSKSDKSSKDGSHKRTHVVGPHETLYSISRKFGVSVGALERANNIKDPTHIRDGSKITIPSKANAD